MVRSILYQILGQRRDLISLVFPTFFGNTKLSPTPAMVDAWSELLTAFDTMLVHLKDSKVCLFIDGLDECRMVGRGDQHKTAGGQLDHIYNSKTR